MLHNYGMMEIVAELSNLDYKPFSVMCKKGHHPQNVQCPIEIKADNHSAWYNRGKALEKLLRYKEAIASYDKAIEIKPDDQLAWWRRGKALDELSRHEEAIASFDKAVEIKPDDLDAWWHRGYALLQLSRYDEAIASYDKAIEIKASSLLFRLESYKTNCEKMEEVIEAMRARDRAKQRDARIL